MPDGLEERQEYETRLEREKREDREDRVERGDINEGEPERGGS